MLSRKFVSILALFVLNLSKHERLRNQDIAFALRQTQGERNAPGICGTRQ